MHIGFTVDFSYNFARPNLQLAHARDINPQITPSTFTKSLLGVNSDPYIYGVRNRMELTLIFTTGPR